MWRRPIQLLALLLTLSHSKQQKTISSINQIDAIVLENNDFFESTISNSVALPIKAKSLHSNSLIKPKVIPLKGQAKVGPTHPNIHLAVQPKVHTIPKELTVFTPRKNSIPLLKTIPSKGNEISAKFKKTTPALSARYKHDANYDIQYLTDNQGLVCPPHEVILEDSREYLWFGSCPFGITLNDGHHFFQFSEQVKNSNKSIKTLSLLFNFVLS